jgi:hypothetical protein
MRNWARAIGGALLVCACAAAADAADQVPSFNTTVSCRGATASDGQMQSCVNDENDARKQLADKWAQFPAADRSHCMAETSIDGTPSYVELLTCLQMASDLKKLPKKVIDFGVYPRISN